MNVVTAILDQCDVDPAALLELVGELAPARGGALGPARVSGLVKTLALHPDQPEVAAGSAKAAVVPVEHSDAPAPLQKTPRQRQADDAATDYCVLGFHRRDFNRSGVDARRPQLELPPPSVID